MERSVALSTTHAVGLREMAAGNRRSRVGREAAMTGLPPYLQLQKSPGLAQGQGTGCRTKADRRQPLHSMTVLVGLLGFFLC